MGRYSDVFGRRPFLILSLIGSCFGSLLQGLSKNMVVFIIFRTLTGLFAGSLIIVQTVIADLIVPEERGVWLTRLESCNSIAFIIGPMLGGFVGTFGYRMPLYALVWELILVLFLQQHRALLFSLAYSFCKSPIRAFLQGRE